MAPSSNQTWNPALYDRNARFVSDLGMPVVDLLAPRPGERILDLGCGDGALTVRLAQAGCAVVAVDASAAMVQAARGRGLDARVMEGTALAFDAGFDAVFSNAALHWMKPLDAVIEGVWRALKPGGRFIGEMGGAGNVSAIVTAVEKALASRGLPFEAPWTFPDAAQFRGLLEARGFAVNAIDLFPRATPLPGSVAEWLDTLATPYFAAIPAQDKTEVIAEAVKALRPVMCDTAGNWTAGYVRLRFAATRPA